jgi:hypothetical protein
MSSDVAEIKTFLSLHGLSAVVATGFMIFRLFDPEDGGNLLPRNFF